MAQKTIGATFSAELAAANLNGLPISWMPDGTINYGDTLVCDPNTGQLIEVPNPGLSQSQRDAIAAVYAAHDPASSIISGLRLTQMEKVNAAAQQVIDTYVASYPDFEKLTWATQQTESDLWTNASQENRIPSLVPWCAAAAYARGVVLPDFMDKVAAKVAAFSSLSAQIAGKRQMYEDQISAASTTETIEAIVWVD